MYQLDFSICFILYLEFRDSFNLFDKENDNRIHVKDLGTVLRSLGLHPTEAELTDLLGTIETEGTYNRKAVSSNSYLFNYVSGHTPS